MFDYFALNFHGFVTSPHLFWAHFLRTEWTISRQVGRRRKYADARAVVFDLFYPFLQVCIASHFGSVPMHGGSWYGISYSYQSFTLRMRGCAYSGYKLDVLQFSMGVFPTIPEMGEGHDFRSRNFYSFFDSGLRSFEHSLSVMFIFPRFQARHFQFSVCRCV